MASVGATSPLTPPPQEAEEAAQAPTPGEVADLDGGLDGTAEEGGILMDAGQQQAAPDPASIVLTNSDAPPLNAFSADEGVQAPTPAITVQENDAAGLPATVKTTSDDDAVVTEAAPTQPVQPVAAAKGKGKAKGARGTKRRSSAAATDANLSMLADAEPRKRRKAALNSRRIVESDEDADVGEEPQVIAISVIQASEPPAVEASAAPAVPEQKPQQKIGKVSLRFGGSRVTAGSSTPAPALRDEASVSKASASPGQTTAPAPSKGKKGKQPAKQTKKGQKQKAQAETQAKIEQQEPLPEPDAAASVIAAAAEKAVESEVPAAPTADTTAQTAEISLANLFGEEDDAQGQNISEEAKLPEGTRNASAGPANETEPTTSAIPTASTATRKSGSLRKLPKDATASPGHVSGSTPIPDGSTPSSFSTAAAVPKKLKRPIPPASTLPKPAPVKQPETSFLDSLFSGTIAQTDHERQLQKEREEKARLAKEAAGKEREKKEGERKYALGRVKPAPSTPKVEEGTPKPTPSAASSASRSALPMFIPKATGKGRGDGDLQSRLGSNLQTRAQEIAKMRTEARQAREKQAALGGFDLLKQGIEMAVVESGLLRDWNTHQQLVWSGGRDGKGPIEKRQFAFYRGNGEIVTEEERIEREKQKKQESEMEWGETMEDEDTLGKLPKSLPHPWTFGAAFTFAGARHETQGDAKETNGIAEQMIWG